MLSFPMVFLISCSYRTPALFGWCLLDYLFSNLMCSVLMLVYRGCCNKLLQMCFKQQKLFSHSLEARSPKSVSVSQNQGVGRNVLPLQVLGESLFLVCLASYGRQRSEAVAATLQFLFLVKLHLCRWERARPSAFFL